MAINRSENKEIYETFVNPQLYVLLLVAVFGVLLLLAPFLPGLISNFIYSLSGEAPKIYWYLSRAPGFVTLSITNKLARQWPEHPRRLPFTSMQVYWDWLLRPITPWS